MLRKMFFGIAFILALMGFVLVFFGFYADYPLAMAVGIISLGLAVHTTIMLDK